MVGTSQTVCGPRGGGKGGWVRAENHLGVSGDKALMATAIYPRSPFSHLLAGSENVLLFRRNRFYIRLFEKQIEECFVVWLSDEENGRNRPKGLWPAPPSPSAFQGKPSFNPKTRCNVLDCIPTWCSVNTWITPEKGYNKSYRPTS